MEAVVGSDLCRVVVERLMGLLFWVVVVVVVMIEIVGVAAVVVVEKALLGVSWVVAVFGKVSSCRNWKDVSGA